MRVDNKAGCAEIRLKNGESFSLQLCLRAGEGDLVPIKGDDLLGGIPIAGKG